MSLGGPTILCPQHAPSGTALASPIHAHNGLFTSMS
jgi:hypothetical protein